MSLGDYPCCADPTSLTGLRPLERAHPRDWEALLRQPAAVARQRLKARIREGHRPTLLEWLSTGADGALLPGNSTWREQRGAVGRWRDYLPSPPLERLRESHLLEAVKTRLADEPNGSRDRWKRDCRFLRQWIHDGQRDLRKVPSVARRWSKIPKAGKLGPLDLVPTLPQILELIAATPDKQLRAMIGLAFGARLTTSEIENIFAEDVTRDFSQIYVDFACKRGIKDGQPAAKIVTLCPWMVDLLTDAFGPEPPESGPLFTSRAQPGSAPTGSDARLRRVARRIGSDGPTFHDLRRAGQSIIRSMGGCQASIRGAVPTSGSARHPTPAEDHYAREQEALSRLWADLPEPPVPPGPVPRRAPKGCKPDEPELAASRRRVRQRFGRAVRGVEYATVPRSCRPGVHRLPPLTARTQLEKRFSRSVHEVAATQRALTAARSALHEEREARQATQEDLAAANQELQRAKKELDSATQSTEALVAARRRDRGEVGAIALTAFAVGTASGMAIERAMTDETGSNAPTAPDSPGTTDPPSHLLPIDLRRKP